MSLVHVITELRAVALQERLIIVGDRSRSVPVAADEAHVNVKPDQQHDTRREPRDQTTNAFRRRRGESDDALFTNEAGDDFVIRSCLSI